MVIKGDSKLSIKQDLVIQPKSALIQTISYNLSVVFHFYYNSQPQPRVNTFQWSPLGLRS